VSEAAFDAALASKDLATVQRAFDRFYEFRQRMEMEQESVIRANVAQTFKHLGLPAPATNLPVDEYGFDTSSIKSYSAFFSGRGMGCSATSPVCIGAKIRSAGGPTSTFLCQRPSSRTMIDGLTS
jgi:hypothetical protein